MPHEAAIPEEDIVKVEIDQTVNPEGVDLTASMTRPKSVAIVALGRTSPHFITEAVNRGSSDKPPFEEVWTVNRGFRGFVHDKLFVMDDFRWIEEKHPAYAEFLKKHDRPIITSTLYPDYPNAVEYPLDEVCRFFKEDCFAVNTIAYMVAYAIMIGVKDIYIYGADFHYPDGQTAEAGGMGVAWLLGWHKKNGGNYHIPAGSAMLYSDRVHEIRPGVVRREHYGYHRKAELAAEKRDKEIR